MLIFCSSKQQIASIVSYLIPFVICIGVVLRIGIIEPLRISKGHLSRYIKELPLLLKMLYVVIIAVPLFITVLSAINLFREVSFFYRAKNDLLETSLFNVDSDIIISDAAYRGGKIGNNISLRINGDFVLTVAVIPDDVIDTILRSEKVEISFGYIGNSLEIWSIRVEDTLECGGEVLVGLPSYCNFLSRKHYHQVRVGATPYRFKPAAAHH